MYLSRLTLAHNRAALMWLSNPYRIHQRLLMGCGDDPRMLFRVESTDTETRILVQTYNSPNWEVTFRDLLILARPPEAKMFDLKLAKDQTYYFRLHANPIVRRRNSRLGLLKEEEQRAWLKRKLLEAGATLLECQVRPLGFQHSYKAGGESHPVHWIVAFEGRLRSDCPDQLSRLIQHGVGPAKGFGCGLLSLART